MRITGVWLKGTRASAPIHKSVNQKLTLSQFENNLVVLKTTDGQ